MVLRVLKYKSIYKKEYRLKFPVLTISDIVNAQMRLYKKLGIKNAVAVIGGR